MSDLRKDQNSRQPRATSVGIRVHTHFPEGTSHRCVCIVRASSDIQIFLKRQAASEEAPSASLGGLGKSLVITDHHYFTLTLDFLYFLINCFLNMWLPWSSHWQRKDHSISLLLSSLFLSSFSPLPSPPFFYSLLPPPLLSPHPFPNRNVFVNF